jgi:hypothetical protein
MYEFPEDTPLYLLIGLNENRVADCNWHSVLVKRKWNEYLKQQIAMCRCSLHKDTNTNSISIQWNQRDALSVTFNKNQWPLYVSSITCWSSGDVTRAVLGILRACYVSWLHHGWSSTSTLYMFGALLAHYKEALHKRHVVCSVRVLSAALG